jgi:fumarate hydratase class I
MIAFLKEKILTLGTAACPPYHLAIVIGGTSAEMNLKTVKLASTRYLDALPTKVPKPAMPSATSRWRKEIHKLTQQLGVGAQFGGKYFCHDVRVIRLPRHGASLPIGSASPAPPTARPRARSPATASSSSSWKRPGQVYARDRRG